MRINLQVPYSDKESVKSLGAKWDVARKTWYIIDPQDLEQFKKWIPSIRDWDEQQADKQAKRALGKR